VALGGSYLVAAADLDEALEFAAACPGAKFGSIAGRPIIEVPADAGAPDATAARSAG
jgi:hypothetical protein